jgi:hypothetical protein
MLLSFLPIKAVITTFMAFGNLSPLRLVNIQDPKSFGFTLRSFSGSGMESLSHRFHSIGFQYVQK